MADAPDPHASTQDDVRRDDPLPDFSRSHAGILIRLEELRALPARLAEPGADRRAARVAAAQIVEFFRVAVLEHHEEEEEALFPAVARAAAPGDEASLVASLAARLAREHRQIEADWKAIEPALERIAKGRPAEIDEGVVARLCDLYAAHAQFEETGYLPLAAKILDANERASLALTLHIRHSVVRVLGYM
jgi:hypothetical protein